MGQRTKILLVITIWLISFVKAEIDLNRYTQFWLWAGVEYQSVLEDAEMVYLHRGQIDAHNHRSYFTPQSGQGVITSNQQFWLVYRVNTLHWEDNIYQEIETHLHRWEKEGGNVIGIQVDYDVPTQKLNDYIIFLTQLREWLPTHYQLSITGLLDWSRHANQEELERLDGVIDELVIQTYQKRETIPNFAQYLENMEYMPFSFKVGIAQYSDWVDPSYLKAQPNFDGYVVFLQNRE